MYVFQHAILRALSARRAEFVQKKATWLMNHLPSPQRMIRVTWMSRGLVLLSLTTYLWSLDCHIAAAQQIWRLYKFFLRMLQPGISEQGTALGFTAVVHARKTYGHQSRIGRSDLSGRIRDVYQGPRGANPLWSRLIGGRRLRLNLGAVSSAVARGKRFDPSDYLWTSMQQLLPLGQQEPSS